MNRFKKEELKNPKPELSSEEKEFNQNVNKLHSKLFPEESDFMYDSYSDSKDRNRGINPMSKEYILKTDLKRKKLGVSAMQENGIPPEDNNSIDFVRKLLKEKGNYKEALKAVSNFVED